MLGEYLSKLMPSVVESGDDQDIVCRICEEGVCPPGSCPARQARVLREQSSQPELIRVLPVADPSYS